MALYPQVRECCGLGGGVVCRVSGPASICVWALGMDQIQGTGLDPLGQAEHGQSQVVARFP